MERHVDGISLPARPESVRRARHFVADAVGRAGFESDTIDLAAIAASELVTNAVRHAGATAVRVRVAATPDALVVTVRDDGAGIAPDAVHGVGLGSMRERAAELGGRCTVRPLERGTEVVAELRGVMEVVAAKASAEEAAAYGSWLLASAQASADAAKEGGFMGFRAEQVSAGEQAMLDRVREAVAT